MVSYKGSPPSNQSSVALLPTIQGQFYLYSSSDYAWFRIWLRQNFPGLKVMGF